jgi:hypothetical protein
MLYLIIKSMAETTMAELVYGRIVSKAFYMLHVQRGVLLQ